MKLIVMLTNHRNLDQTSAIIADQTVLNTANQVQWQYTEKFDQLLVMLGTIHIGMVFMSANRRLGCREPMDRYIQ